MAKKTVKTPQPANPNIEQVLDEFLADQRKRLKPRTLSRYEDIVALLQHCLDGYGHQYLSKAEQVLYDKRYNAEGEEHREFCKLFGPEKILDGLSEFLGYFMIRKVMGGQELMQAAGTVTKKLSKWLAEKGYISSSQGQMGIEEGADAARDLPGAERAARILYEAAQNLFHNPNGLNDEDYLDFDHYTIARIEPGKLWFDLFRKDKRLLGPVHVPKKAAELLKEGWAIGCAPARIRTRWYIVEVGNVYPM